MADPDGMHIIYSVTEFAETLKASFIGSSKPADERYAPRFVVNDKRRAQNVLTMIKAELADCVSFDFSVAFITSSGIQVLVQILNELKDRNIPGRILTSTYLGFNDPEALRKLLEFPNLKTKVYEGDLHAKGYFFNRPTLSTFIIGSSNLTHQALTCNKEWNVLFRSFDDGEMLHSAKEEYESLWRDSNSKVLTPMWLDEYEKRLRNRELNGYSRIRLREYVEGIEDIDLEHTSERITPNNMQKNALSALQVLHDRGERRALLVSATGTGKTYLSALEVEQQRPKRVLFVAHRQRILDASLHSYRDILGDSYTYSVYRGGGERPTTDCVFAMIGMLSRHLEEFEPTEFDYIIIDEAHRSGAESYRRVINYFKPKFLLGMTATPDRSDGYDVYKLYNHVIAYRISLREALENQMLTPFHYFGIADLSIDERELDNVALFSRLTSEERVRHVINKIEEYTVDKRNRRGLIFCSRNDEARELSKRFNDLGYRTVAISGATNEYDRNLAISRLESGDIEYIFSVDILNEGVDIPSVNQVIMLRKTESAVVFMQQLGRGLRKQHQKDYTLVLDFIGNYQQNYLIPMALAEDRSYDKDTLRRIVKEGSSIIPGASTVSFERISEQRIFRSLEESNFTEAKLIRSEYQHLKQMLGRIPRLADFDTNEVMDPLNIIKKYKSYAAFLQTYEKDLPDSLSKRKLELLAYLSKFASGKRRGDLLVLKRLVQQANWKTSCSSESISYNAEEVQSIARVLTGTYYPKANVELVEYRDGVFELSQEFARALQNPMFLDQVDQIIDFGLARNSGQYADTYKDTDFVLYEKYNIDEICRLLRWDHNPNPFNIGGYYHDKRTNTFPVFINYEKDPSISATTKYEDRFESENRLIAISKSKRTLHSPEIEMLKHADTNGVRCFLFIRKNKKDKNESKEYYFLGEIHPTGEFKEIVMDDAKTRAVEIVYDIEESVRADIYDYLTSSFNEE